MNRLIIIRGIPGVGKTTLAQKLGSVYFEADMYFIRGGKYQFNYKELHSAHLWCRYMVSAAMQMETSQVVVSNTFKTQKEIDEYIRLAVQHQYQVEIIQLLKEYGSIHGVPENIMEMARRKYIPNNQLDLDKYDINIQTYTVNR